MSDCIVRGVARSVASCACVKKPTAVTRQCIQSTCAAHAWLWVRLCASYKVQCAMCVYCNMQMQGALTTTTTTTTHHSLLATSSCRARGTNSPHCSAVSRSLLCNPACNPACSPACSRRHFVGTSQAAPEQTRVFMSIHTWAHMHHP